MTNNLRTAIATFILATAMTPAAVLAQSAYPVNFDENEAATNTGALHQRYSALKQPRHTAD